MGWITRSLGLTLSVPTDGTKNWGTQILSDFVDKISAHDHSGGGKGLPVTVPDGTITTVKLNINADLPMGGNKITGMGALTEDLAFSGTSGKSVRFSESAGSVLAAGTDQASATALARVMSYCGGGTGGVRLPAIASWAIGRPLFLFVGVDVNLYPASGETILGRATNAPEALSYLAGGEHGVMAVPFSSTTWAIFKAN